MSVHVPTYLLLELAAGELGPERNILPHVLDHLERCSECSAVLQVMVTLKANRDEALEALRAAEGTPKLSTLWGNIGRWLSRLVRR